RQCDGGAAADEGRFAGHARTPFRRDHQRVERGRVLLRPRVDVHGGQGVGDVVLRRVGLGAARLGCARDGAVSGVHAHRVPRPRGAGEDGPEGVLVVAGACGGRGVGRSAARPGDLGAEQALQGGGRHRAAVAEGVGAQARWPGRGTRSHLRRTRVTKVVVSDLVSVVTPSPSLDQAAKIELARLVTELCVVHGKVTLASGAEADYYIDLRRATLHHGAAPLIGKLMRQLTADWDYVAVGGLTLGADPVATAMLDAAALDGVVLDVSVMSKSFNEHGMLRRIEGMEVAGQRVLALEDTSTTGGSVLTAVDALREAGATVVGVATVVERATGAKETIEARGLPYRYLLDLDDLGLI